MMIVNRITPPTTQELQPGNPGYGPGGDDPIMIDVIGPVNVAGSLFIPMGIPTFNGYVTFFVSTDNGVTWTPDASGIKQACRNWAADWNPITGLFTIAYLPNAGVGAGQTIRIRQYNPTTQTWGANLTAGMLTAAVLTVHTRSNGDVVVGHITTLPFPKYYASVLSGGVWVDVLLDIAPDLPRAIPNATSGMDANDNFHIFVQGYTGAIPPFNVVSYFRLLANNTLDGMATGIPILLTGPPPFFPGTDFVGLPNQVVINDAEDYWILPYSSAQTTPSGYDPIAVVKGQGLSAGVGSVLSYQIVQTADIGFFASSAGPTVVMSLPGDGNLYITVVESDPIVNPGWVFTAPATTPLGPYALSVWFNQGAVPDQTTPPTYGASVTSVILRPDNTPAYVFNGRDVASNLSGRYLLGAAAPPVPPVITCGAPPNGTTGTAYSHTLPVASGTAPFTFALTGGALPPGLSLDASTGTISGTPTTSGTFSFTVQVTDANALTSSVTCAITVAFDVSVIRITLRGVKRYRQVNREEPPAGPRCPCSRLGLKRYRQVNREEPQVYEVPNLPGIDQAR